MTEPQRARFMYRGTVPPIGWVYEIEHEGETFRFQAPMQIGLMTQLKRWYADKKLEWPGEPEMRARIEHFICQRLPKGFCVGGPDQPAVPYLSVSKIRDGTRLLMGRLFRGKDFLVKQEEADRRAKICANCPEDLRGICSSCMSNEFFDIFGWMLRANRKTPYDSALEVCAVCGCLLTAKVHISNETLFALSKHKYPPNCWLAGTPADLTTKVPTPSKVPTKETEK